MSCNAASNRTDLLPEGVLATLGDEGFRLFFPLAAVYLALFPALWVIAWGLDLPLATRVPPSLWHAHEMMIGGFGAALIGFMTTAAPEWTNTEPPRGGWLWSLAAVWTLGRLVGLLGWDGAGWIGAVADLVWLSGLLVWLLVLSWQRRTDKVLTFVFWMSVLIACFVVTRLNFANGNVDLAHRGLTLIGFTFLGILGLALSRITVPITNLILDPTERTSPFRPHPGRLHLAPGLVFVAILGEAMGLSPAVSAYLVIAAGCAFMDRVAEAFIGREIARAEILLLAGSSAVAGVGLLLLGAARLGAPWSEVVGWHVALMGGTGLGVYAVFCIAGLLHTNQPLGLSTWAKLGAIFLIASVALRVSPDLGLPLPGPMLAFASVAWTISFLLWLGAYWSSLTSLRSAKTASAEGADAFSSKHL